MENSYEKTKTARAVFPHWISNRLDLILSVSVIANMCAMLSPWIYPRTYDYAVLVGVICALPVGLSFFFPQYRDLSGRIEVLRAVAIGYAIFLTVLLASMIAIFITIPILAPHVRLLLLPLLILAAIVPAACYEWIISTESVKPETTDHGDYGDYGDRLG